MSVRQAVAAYRVAFALLTVSAILTQPARSARYSRRMTADVTVTLSG